MEKGSQMRLRKMILKGLRMGIDINQIAETADVDVEFVLQLKRELDK